MIRRRGRHAARARVPFGPVVVVLAAAAGSLLLWRLGAFQRRSFGEAARSASASPTAVRSPVPSPPTSPSPSRPPVSTSGPINTSFPGLTTFRGNASRSYYGDGPVPAHPEIVWRYPESGGLCMRSSDQNGVRTWCGTGWTGQPNVLQRPDGTIEVRIGAYDGRYHFLDGVTGRPIRPDLVTGDLAKGSATSDPDGYPLYYAGSRDNLFRIVALDRPEPTVLWSIDADTSVPNPMWNNDWDGAALVIGDYLLEGGENSWLYVVRLHRGYDAAGMVTVHPRIVATIPGWDDRLLSDLGDTDVSIEDSVAFRDGVVYFANSGGLVQGWDVSNLLRGGSRYRRVFRFWDGDETDASIVIDDAGYLYVARHRTVNVPSRPIARDHEVGDLMKLDPHNPAHPVVWSIQLGGFEPDGGLLGTPALFEGVVYATFTEGGVAAVDARTGRLLWKRALPGPTWSSPVVIDGRLLVGDGAGYLNCFDVSHRGKPPRLLWRLEIGGTIESTPAVWRGWIFVGTRAGGIYGIADRGTVARATRERSESGTTTPRSSP